MTYSIVARDAKTGQFGVAVQSHYFQVSPAVPWAKAGVGAVATQSHVNLSYGPLGLELLEAGYTAEQALAALTAGDPKAEVRQCAIVDAAGNVAAHTGAKCIPAAGHTLGDGFSCEANLMEKDTVWDAMAHAFTTTDAPLAERMMAALEAAEAEGGDIRGKQSAAMVVVAATGTGRPWNDRIIDLRVEDSAEPLPELRRLLRIKRAYMTASDADALEEEGDMAGAIAKLHEALAIAPEMVELRIMTGVTMASAGDVDGGCALIAEAVRKNARWVETLHRFAAVDLMKPEVVAAIEARLASTSRPH
ncbi:MAG TPA: DUF1028 domain-containing protein [Candidatus Dormibacteraeota bacterium]|nr:DUF1028 domain-containing protein [Candidatus Dormibacteraeota bacterium]